MAIIEAFKTWHHYLKNYKYKDFVFINNNIFCRFINIKSLSSTRSDRLKSFFNIFFRSIIIKTRQIKLLMLYCTFFNIVKAKKKTFYNKNTKIFYFLQNLFIKVSLTGLSLFNFKTNTINKLLYFIRFLFVKLTFYLNYTRSRSNLKAN